MLIKAQFPLKIERLSYILRSLENRLQDAVSRGKSVLLLGPRQTGKTTLINQLKASMQISFIQPRVRLRYEKDPSILCDEVEAIKAITKPLIIIDEVQKVPLIMDVAQDLIDRKLAQFVIIGSSAPKLKHGKNINLLPGRVIPMHLDPLMLDEIPADKQILTDHLLYGLLPEIINTSSKNEKEELLEAYVSTYLEEEIRA